MVSMNKNPLIKLFYLLLSTLMTIVLVSSSAEGSAYDVQHYKIEIDLSKSLTEFNHCFTGHVATTVIIDTLAINELIFSSFGSVIDSIKINAANVDYHLKKDNLFVSLDRTYSKGEQLTIDFYYTHLDSFKIYYGGYRFEPAGDHNSQLVAYTFGVPAYAHLWFPCKEDPSDKALLDIIVAVPSSDYVVVSNGILLNKTYSVTENKTYYHWREVHPIWTAVIFFAVSKYQIFTYPFQSEEGTKEVQFYVWPADSKGFNFDATICFEKIIDILDFYSSIFTDFPFDNLKVAFTRIPVSNQSVIQVNEWALHNLSTMNSVYTIWPHEIAHQWFGCYLNSNSLNELWLNEGFACYSHELYKEHILGYTNFREDLNLLAKSAMEDDISLANPPYPYHSTFYSKGPCVLDMLRYCLGDSIFWNVISTYLKKFAFSAASTKDLASIVNEIANEDYSWFFEQWVYNAGFPIYNIKWHGQLLNENSYLVNIRVEQIQSSPNYFKMPLRFRIISDESDSTITFFNDCWIQDFVFQFPGIPQDVIFDENNRILLKKVDIVSEVDHFIQKAPDDFVLSQNFPNPFNQSTIINFKIPRNGKVEFEIYNLLGNKVKTLVSDFKKAGNYQIKWDGTDDKGNLCQTGLYIYHLIFENKIKTRKLLLIK